jgi:hypothetical protein
VAPQRLGKVVHQRLGHLWQRGVGEGGAAALAGVGIEGELGDGWRCTC